MAVGSPNSAQSPLLNLVWRAIWCSKYDRRMFTELFLREIAPALNWSRLLLTLCMLLGWGGGSQFHLVKGAINGCPNSSLCRQTHFIFIKFIICVNSLIMSCKFYMSEFEVSAHSFVIFIFYLLVWCFICHLHRFTAPILPQIIPFLGKHKDNIQVLEGKF